MRCKGALYGVIASLSLGLLACTHPPAQEQTENSQPPKVNQERKKEMSEEEILKGLYRQINQAMVEKDTDTLSQLLRDDTELVHMTGYRQPVVEWLEQIETEEMKYYSWEEDAIKDVQIDGHRASLIGQSRVKARIWGSGPSTWRLQIKMYFEKVDGQWQIIKQVASTY